MEKIRTASPLIEQIKVLRAELTKLSGMVQDLEYQIEQDKTEPTKRSFVPSLYEEASAKKIEEAKIWRDTVISQMGGVEFSQVVGPSRKREHVHIRQVLMFLLYRHKGLNVTETAKLFERDHTTVLHSIKVINRDLEVEKKFGGSKPTTQLLNTISEILKISWI